MLQQGPGAPDVQVFGVFFLLPDHRELEGIVREGPTKQMGEVGFYCLGLRAAATCQFSSTSIY